MAGEFDSRLTVLERHAISTEKRLDGVDTKLDQIMGAVTVAGAEPTFNPAAVVECHDAAVEDQLPRLAGSKPVTAFVIAKRS